MSPVDRSSTSSSIGLPLSLGGEKETKEVKFIRSQNYCVCFVQMMNSTGVSTTVNDTDNIRIHYTIFINTMSIIAMLLLVQE